MAMFADESGKSFSKPATGKYIGTIIDIVDLGLKKPKNPSLNSEPVRRVQIIWLAVGPDGKPFEYSEAPPFKLGAGGGQFKPTRLYQIVSGVLGAPPPQPFAEFDVETILGKSNELFIVKTGDGDTARSEIAGFLPVPPNVTPPQADPKFVRKINQPARQSQSVQTAPAPQAQPAQAREVSF